MTDSKPRPQHTAQNPQYPGPPCIWADPENGNVIIGTAEGDALFSIKPDLAEAVSDMLVAARTYAKSQRSQAKFMHKLNRERAVAEFRRAYLRANAGREIQKSELEDEVDAFSDNYDREHGFDPDELYRVNYPHG